MADLDQGSVQSKFQELAAYLQDQYPDVDVRHGVFANLVLSPAAILAAYSEKKLQEALREIYAQDIMAGAVTASRQAIDKIAANFGLRRRAASKASGTLWIVVSQLANQTIATGTQFTNGSATFATTETYYLVTSADAVTSPYHKFPFQIGTNQYGFTLPVTAVTAGAIEAIPPGAPFSLVNSGAIQYVTSITAFDSFLTGRNEETDSELLSRLAVGVTPRTPYTKYGILAILNDASPDLAPLDVNVVGPGSPVALRTRHWLFPVGMGMQLDVYVKTSRQLVSRTVEVAATLVNKTAKTWQFTVPADLAPGYYRIAKICLRTHPSTNFAPPLSETRGYDTSLSYVPDIASAIEAAYSRYQTATVQFTDTITDTGPLTEGVSQQIYFVTFRLLPYLKEISDILADPANRTNNSDILVKAVIPCQVQMTLNLANAGGSAFDTAALKNALAKAVSDVPIGWDLTIDTILATIQEQAPGWALTSSSLQGTIYRPDGTNQTITGTSGLSIPENTAIGMGRDSVSFFCDPADITITTS